MESLILDIYLIQELVPVVCNNVIIWSTPTCNFCVKAKTTLNILKIDYEEKIIGKDYTKEQFLEAVPNARTVPQIFIDDKHIGGYNELLDFLESDAK